VGGKPHRLDLPGADLCITSDEALELEKRPDKVRMAVVAACVYLARVKRVQAV
jgi:hypothetical protein